MGNPPWASVFGIRMREIKGYHRRTHNIDIHEAGPWASCYSNREILWSSNHARAQAVDCLVKVMGLASRGNLVFVKRRWDFRTRIAIVAGGCLLFGRRPSCPASSGYRPRSEGSLEVLDWPGMGGSSGWGSEEFLELCFVLNLDFVGTSFCSQAQ